jgi:hypothetical protein
MSRGYDTARVTAVERSSDVAPELMGVSSLAHTSTHTQGNQSGVNLVHAHKQALRAAAPWHVMVEQVQVSQWPTSYRLALGCTTAERRRDPAGK